MPAPVLVVLAGRPGTGKTTLARRLSVALGACYLRVDVIEAAIGRSAPGEPLGPVGYAVAHDLAAANLALGRPVVVDAVNPVPEARAGWRQLAELGRIVVLETVLPDEAEHRRRVEQRRPDLAGHRVPTWTDVLATDYQPWDEARDGARRIIDMTDTEHGVADALSCIRAATGRPRTVGVCGPGGVVSSALTELARDVGQRLAHAGFVVATGGLDGVMAAASRGAREAGGVVVGLLPGDRASAGNEHLSVALPTGLGQARNAVLVTAVDAVVAVGASAGTLSEVALALRSDTPVVWLHGWQITDDTGASVAVPTATDAAEAVDLVTRALHATG